MKRFVVRLLTSYWFWAVTLGVGVHVAGILVFRIAPTADLSPPKQEAFLNLAQIDLREETGYLQEQIHLFDTAPLFLPTRWNADRSPSSRQRQPVPRDVFPLFDPEMPFTETGFSLEMPDGLPAPVDARQSLVKMDFHPFSAFGRQDDTRTPLPERAALVEIVSVDSGEVVLEVEMKARTPDESVDALWNPMEFSYVKDMTGTVIEPLLIRGSGNQEVDQRVLAFIRRPPPGFQTLPPGYYRIIAGP